MKIRNKAFKEFSKDYDDWFVKNENIYKSELEIFKKLKISGKSIEIGVGSGKFALPLGIKFGVEPTRQMYDNIKDTVRIVEGVAENLPIKDDIFDWAVMVTTICFVLDPLKSLQEMYRILKIGGKCAIGFVDKESPIGKLYQQKKNESKFYYEATFFSSEEIINLMKSAGFFIGEIWQTLYGEFSVIKEEIQTPMPGYGEGSFVVVMGEKR